MINEFQNTVIPNKKITSREEMPPVKHALPVNPIDSKSINTQEDPLETVLQCFQSENINVGSSNITMRLINPGLQKKTIEVKTIALKESQKENANQVQINTPSKANASLYHIAQDLMELFKFILIDEKLYVWNINEGIYFSMEQTNAEKFIRKYSPFNIKQLLTTAKIKEILKWIESESVSYNLSQLQTVNQQFIVFNNGLYNLQTGLLQSFEPDVIFTHKLNVNYTSEPKTSRDFEQFIYEITEDDPDFYDQLQELFGYVISEVRNVKTLPILLGPKDSGKSICLKILEALVGERNSSSISLAQLHRTEFLSELNSKKLNTCGEISSSVNFSIELLKQLTGGDTLMARGLYNNPFKFKNTAAMVFAGNSLPGFSNKDSHNALLKRISLFYFTNSIPHENQDIYLLDKILSNLEYVANWALEGFIKWRANNFIFTIPSKAEYFIQQTSIVTNSLESFINQNCIFSDEFTVYKQDFIIHYHQFCEGHNIDPQSENHIDKILMENYTIKRKKARLNGAPPKSAYFGIKLDNNFITEEF